MIKLVINADDFGYSKVFNEKILELLEKGFIKSTTVLVKRITSEQKEQINQLAEIAKTGRASVGLHCDIDESKPVKPQVADQFSLFIKTFGLKPSHLDIHKLVHDQQVIKEVVEFAEQEGLPVRNHGVKSETKQTSQPAVSKSKTWVFTFEELKNVIEGFKEGETYELITHPGDYDPDCPSSLNKERKQDYENLLKLKSLLDARGIKLISYNEL